MAITGKTIIPERIMPAMEVETKICDICGADATQRTACMRCKKDLCVDHQIDVGRMISGRYEVDKVFSGGLYCKECLIFEINEGFK